MIWCVGLCAVRRDADVFLVYLGLLERPLDGAEP
jgi:hypothetical protein